ncbi:MAG: hypothetical protein ACP5NQ_07770 [Vulcanisaeta sp.]
MRIHFLISIGLPGLGVAQMPWATERKVKDALEYWGFIVKYVNLRPSPDLVAVKFLDLPHRLKHVWYIEVKGSNQWRIPVKQLKALVELASVATQRPCVVGLPFVAVVGDGLIEFYNGYEMLLAEPTAVEVDEDGRELVRLEAFNPVLTLDEATYKVLGGYEDLVNVLTRKPLEEAFWRLWNALADYYAKQKGNTT